MRLPGWSKGAARILLLTAALAVGGLAVADRWSQVGDSIGRVGPWPLVGSLALVGVAEMALMLSWRALMTDLGDRLAVRAASRIVFLSALGKYLPGSVWPYLAQVEMSRRYRIPRSRSAAVSVMGVLIGLVTALLTAAASLPWTSPVATRRYWPVFLAVPLLLVLLHPRVANRLLGKALTLARRPPLDRDLTWKGLMVSTGWGLLVWIAFGLQVWVLGSAVAHPGARGLAISVGGYALAWSAGFLVVIAPAGAGVREAALTAALSPVMPTGAALAVALLSRAVTTAGDVGAALVAGVTTIRDHSDAVADGEEALDPPADGADALASSDSPPGDR